MTHDELRAACLAQPAAEETIPFGPGALVYKVMGKMFALLPDDLRPGDPLTISLKVEPHYGEILRETYAAVLPGYHLNKRHWISATANQDVPDDELLHLIENSYLLVVKGLTRARRDELAAWAKGRGAQ